MEKFDRISSLFFFFLSLGICVESIRLSLGTLRAPGSGFFTFVAGAMVAGLSLVLYLTSRKKGKGSKSFWEVEKNKKYIFMTISLLIIYGFLIEAIGFLTSTILFFFFITRFISLLKSRIAIPVSVLISVFAFVLFNIWFESQLPMGVLERGLLWIFGKI